MTLVMACLLVTIGVFGLICLHLNERIQNANFVIDALTTKVNYLEQKAEVNKESIKLQNESIRDVFDVVKKIVKENEPSKPDTKALISGWDADEPEPLPQLISKEEAMQIIKANLNCQMIEPLPQQCIYPWQSGQLRSCAMLPLWYMNMIMEDM